MRGNKWREREGEEQREGEVEKKRGGRVGRRERETGKVEWRERERERRRKKNSKSERRAFFFLFYSEPSPYRGTKREREVMAPSRERLAWS